MEVVIANQEVVLPQKTKAFLGAIFSKSTAANTRKAYNNSTTSANG